VPLVELRLRIPFARAPHAETLLLARTLTDGTDQLGRDEIAERLDLAGARIGITADADRLLIAASALADAVEPLLSLLLGLLTRATYPEDRLAAQRPRIAQELAMARADAGGVALRELNTAIYDDHPYAGAAADPRCVADATQASVRALAAERLRPAGAVLVLVGDLDPERTLDSVARVMGDWGPDPDGQDVPPARRDHDPAPGTWPGSLRLVERPGAVQSVLRSALPARPPSHPEAAEQELANFVLGGYFSSRLVLSLRERHGYAYAPRTTLVFPRAASVLLVSADVATEVTAGAYKEIGRLLAGMREDPPSVREIDHARRYAVGLRLRALSTQASVADLTMELAARGLRLTWLREHCARLMEADAETVREVAARLADPAGAATVVVGDTRAAHAAAGDEAWARPWGGP
jgi:predicted Zn-dependent peptidase